MSPLIVIYAIILTGYYLNAGRNLTRLQRISFSPIMTIFSETIRGLDIIRTSHVEEETKNKFLEKIDERYGIHLFSQGCRRWHAIRRSTFINLTFGIIILYMANHPEYYSVRAIAIILQYTEEFLNHLINTSTFYMDLETNMIGLERCEQILKIEMEKGSENVDESLINDNWPKTGNIEFINYFASYRPNIPDILKNINLKIEDKEKIGIIGRTGSGKSSLINAIARIIEPKSGNIMIDDIDIQEKSLKLIREKISILPQELFLIESTLRDNIDPLGKHSDEEILNIIKDLSLFKSLSDKEKLNYEIKENGKNLSTGEKKLICFARTVIRNNKIVILDEPTSSLDSETKEIIHENIKKYLKDSTTILITNQKDLLKLCKRIIVIENGEVVEEGKYSKLIKDKNSLFHSLFVK
jgi:ABC-type multidrug transport system fused ATPase/permease subunit